MAILKKAAQKPAEPEKRKPDFIVRAKVKEDVWVSIGAAWSAKLKGGVTGYSLKINTFCKRRSENPSVKHPSRSVAPE